MRQAPPITTCTKPGVPNCTGDRLTATSRPSGQDAASRQASLKHPFAQRDDEADFLRQRDKVAGRQQTLLRMAPAQKRFKTSHIVAFQIHHRLIVNLKLISDQRAAQLDLHSPAVLHLCIHGALEEAERPSSVIFCTVQRQIGVAKKLVGRGAVFGTHRDADACTDDDVLSLDRIGLAHFFDRAKGEGRGVGRLCNARLHDSELIPTHARDRIGIPRYELQPFGDHLQKLVAGGMTEGVVDILEAIEVEEVNCHDLSAPSARQAMAKPLVEQYPVGQTGKGIMPRHVGDLGLGLPLLGNVLVRRDRSAVRHGLHRNGDAAPVA